MKQTVLISLFLAGSAVAMPPASQSLTVRGQDDAATPESTSSLNLNDAANIYARQAANGFKQASTVHDCRKEFDADLDQGWRPCVNRQDNAARDSCSKQKSQADLGPCKFQVTGAAQDAGACIAGVLREDGLNVFDDDCQREAEQQAVNCAEQFFNSKDKSDAAFWQCADKVEPSYRDCAKNRRKAGLAYEFIDSRQQKWWF